MQTKTKVLGTAAAAGAVCSAVSVVPALLAGGGLATLGGAAFAGNEVFAVAALAVAVGAALYWQRRRTARKAALGCGCGGNCGDGDRASPTCALPSK